MANPNRSSASKHHVRPLVRVLPAGDLSVLSLEALTQKLLAHNVSLTVTTQSDQRVLVETFQSDTIEEFWIFDKFGRKQISLL